MTRRSEPWLCGANPVRLILLADSVLKEVEACICRGYRFHREEMKRIAEF